MQRLFISLIAFVIFVSSPLFDTVFAALPSSTHYSIRDYNFGAGGTQNSSSTNFKALGIVGQVDTGSLSSTNYQTLNGLVYVQLAALPPAPTFTNPSSWYNKLSLVLDNANNPTDAEFLIAISPDSFTTTDYVQADDTINTSPVWQTYSSWGGSGGITIIGLTPGTTYTVKVAARQGNYTQTGFGPTATAATANPSLSFSLTPNSINLGTLTPGSVTTSSNVTVTTSTNGAGGNIVWISDANSGLTSSSTSSTIAALSGDLSSTLQGYGIQGTSVTQTSGGPMEILSPYNVSSSNVGTVSQTEKPIFDSSSQPITSGQGVFQILAKASATTIAAPDYADTISVVTSANF